MQTNRHQKGKLTRQYYIKLKTITSNTVYKITFDPKYRNPFQQKEKAIKTFELRMEPIIQETEITISNL